MSRSGAVTEDDRFLVVRLYRGCDPTNALYYFDLKAANNEITGKLALKPLFNDWDAKYSVSTLLTCCWTFSGCTTRATRCWS